MEEIILEFRMAVHRENPNLVDEDFVNDFMFHNNLSGQDIYDKLIEELNKI